MSTQKKKTPPVLYSPLKVVFLSFLFTPIFGGFVQAKNWEVLGEKSLARLSQMWVRTTIWLVILYVVMQALFVDEPLMKYSGPYFLLVVWLVWFFSAGMKQVKYVKEHFGTAWEPKPLGRPIIIAGLCWVLYMMTTVSIGLAMSIWGESHPEKSDAVVIRHDASTGKTVVEPAPAQPANTEAPAQK